MRPLPQPCGAEKMTALGEVVLMRVSEIRQVFLPYCLQRLEDGRYILLNRYYKPVGVHSDAHVVYEQHPSCFRFKRALSARQATALSCKGDPSVDVIYLYNDGCVPTKSAANWTAYSKRLERLAAYDVKG